MTSKAIPLDNATGTGLSWTEIITNDQDMTFTVKGAAHGSTLTLGLNVYTQQGKDGNYLVPKTDFKTIAGQHETRKDGYKFVRITYDGADVSCSIGNLWISAD